MTTAVGYPATAPATAAPARVRRPEIVVVALLAVVAMAAWLPFLHRPLTADESGFLLIARQWRPGHSLYDDLWVDRPPLLIWLFALATHLGPNSATTAGFLAPGVRILAASGLSSPYENPWSLPARVRDPHLTRLRGVLAGPTAPRWVVVDGGSLDTWGPAADNAQQYLVRHYVERVTYDNWHVWQRRSAEETSTEARR